MTKPTHELQISASIPTTDDAMDQTELINKGADAIKALREFVKAHNGTLTVKPVRKMGPRPTGAPVILRPTAA